MSSIFSFRRFLSSTGLKYKEPSELSIDPAQAGAPSTVSPREQANEPTTPYRPYQYPPLDEAKQEIRLVTLLPGEFQSDIHVSLTTVRATEHDVLDFESLSYAWGPAEDPQTIFIGVSGQETLSVTRNIREALPYLRDAKKPRVLWIDAICVNQKDLEERSSQVRRMAWIYSKAKRVIVWLGPASTDSHIALECCNTVSSKINVDWWSDTMSPLSGESHWTDTFRELPFDDKQNIAICNFFHRSWFERLWVWQEIHQAQEIIAICGVQVIPWPAISDMVFCLQRKVRPRVMKESITGQRRDLIYELCKSRRGRRKLLSLIKATKYCQCSDPRDRIFALLSLVPDSEKEVGIEPDYTKDVYEVYQDVAIKLAKWFGTLKLLHTVEMHEHLVAVPSWVPDWSTPTSTLHFTYTGVAAQADLDSQEVDFPRPSVLQATGVIVTGIKIVKDFNLERADSNSLGLIRVQEAVYGVGLRPPFSKGSSQLKSLCRTLRANRFYETYYPKESEFLSLEECEGPLVEILTHKSVKEIATSWETVRFLGSLRQTCIGRSLFICEQGKTGLAPQGAREGDVVVTLLGCETAMVLRPTTNNQYQFVGEAYYYEAMSWTDDALFGPLPGSYELIVCNADRKGYPAFIDRGTGFITPEDPRLGPLPEGWKLYPHERSPYRLQFKNDKTGQSTRKDPRLSPKALRKRGVKLQVFDLV